jgi:hypothetical protein
MRSRMYFDTAKFTPQTSMVASAAIKDHRRGEGIFA